MLTIKCSSHSRSIKIKAISFYKILSDFRFAGRLVKRYTFSDSVQQKYHEPVWFTRHQTGPVYLNIIVVAGYRFIHSNAANGEMLMSSNNGK